MSFTYKTINPEQLSVGERQKLLATAIAPRPICFASTISADGTVNLSPFSYFNVFSGTPPVMVFSPVRRGRDGTTKHTHLNIQEVPEVVINVVSYAMVEQMSLASAEYDRGVNEFTKSGFTEIPSDTVRPPRVAETPVAFECTVDDVIELGDGGGAGNLVIARVQLMHINREFLDRDENLDPELLDLVGRMGGSWYVRASGSSMFEIPKPLRNLGIGVDQLPEAVRNSPVLTGNNLGRLGNLAALPDSRAIEEARDSEAFTSLIRRYSGDELTQKVHEYARQLIDEGESDKALAILMAAES